MKMGRTVSRVGAIALLLTIALPLVAAPKAKAKKPPQKKMGKPGIIEVAKAGADFSIQGEYVGTKAGRPCGAQVIALGDGSFQAVFYNGGLPGAGWDGKGRIPIDGSRDGERILFMGTKHQKKYMGANPSEFSALDRNPPGGQKAYTATIKDGVLEGQTEAGMPFQLKKVMRESPSLLAKPPEGAKVLLAYRAGKAPDLSGWSNPDWRALPEGSMLVLSHPTEGRREKMSATKFLFGKKSFHLHLEFNTPFMPKARSQARGNSGVFPPPGREFQVLDSFGLEGKPNEAGGVYKDHPSMVNMCLPPLSWQTYDIHYTCPEDAKDAKAFYKALLNGVVIHDRVVVPKPSSAQTPRPLQLQDHLNMVRYRNIWVLEN